MSRDFGIFMPKHLAVQWLLNSYYKSTKSYQPVLVPENVSRGNGQQGRGTLCGRLGQALRSSIYADFREGQLTLVNIVGVNA